MTAFQNPAGVRSMRETDANATQSRSTCTWLYIKSVILRWQTIPDSLVLLTACIIIPFLEYGIIPSSKTGFMCGDPLISHKFKGEIITPEILGVASVFLPLILLTLSEILKNKRTGVSDLYLFGFYMKQMLVGATVVILLTEIAKSIIAEHRPHFLDVCEPDTAKGCVNGSWIEDFTCTSTRFTDYFMNDSSRSFPSGHSSIAGFVGVFCVYLVHVRFSVSQIGELTKPLLISVCLTYVLTCALTRISDRRHHWWDVLTGVIMGALMGLYYVFLTQTQIRKNRTRAQESSLDAEHRNHIV